MRVELDGCPIEASTAAETFALSLERLGCERVSALGLRLCGRALVSKDAPHSSVYGLGYRRIGVWYVVTHSNTEAKKRLLERIERELAACISVTLF
jgi:hypothetical protein